MTPFRVGMLGAAGVLVTYAVAQMVVAARDVLVLMGLGFFLAAGLEPFVSRLARRMPRTLAVFLAMVFVVGPLVGFLLLAMRPLIDQATQFAARAPEYVERSDLLERFQVKERIESAFRSTTLLTGLFGAGRIVLGVLGGVLVVLVLTAYFLADLPRIRRWLYRLAPRSRRDETQRVGDEIFAKISAYVLGNVLVSLIAGLATFAWLTIFNVPYALLLSLAVALLDLVPAIGAWISGIAVTLVALTVSLPIAIATAVFFVVYQAVENYFIAPKVMGRVLDIPGVVTVVAVLIGGALLGVVGAIVSIPVAASLLFVFREFVVPRLDRAGKPPT
ncbi:AI-2E family transporter [Lentzea sp. NBRC 105346]|uniref:AI-2E family transporter n=1 Tax=Lentzea sp. NBRC 105346 TaxID=3032205 RepID=UPI0024A1952A|nr:AI-2E family transporter [Lentzea sp. NBRC 105346]GLZ35996.1 AI-2E family transporter [Lentzea sp. NBRC 105346]